MTISKNLILRIATLGWTPVAHTYLAIWETEIGRIVVQGQPRKILCETPPISRIVRAKWTRGVAQSVEHLLCKLKP
jgi:hypothetical protein